MHNNDELRAALNMVLARLDDGARDAAAWSVIAEHLRASTRYAEKTAELRKRFEEKFGAVK